MFSSLASLSLGFHPPAEMSSHCITCQKNSAMSCQREPITFFFFFFSCILEGGSVIFVFIFLPVFVRECGKRGGRDDDSGDRRGWSFWYYLPRSEKEAIACFIFLLFSSSRLKCENSGSGEDGRRCHNIFLYVSTQFNLLSLLASRLSTPLSVFRSLLPASPECLSACEELILII